MSALEFPANASPACPCCQQARFRWLFAKKGRHFWRCAGCGYQRIHPQPTRAELQTFYDHSYGGGMYQDFMAANVMKRLTAQTRFALIRPYCREGRWLDVGCSSGLLVETARRAGMEAEGIDLSEVAVEKGKADGLKLTCSAIEEFQPGYRFDTITCFDVLEHVLDPEGFLRTVYRLLLPGGTVCISVPDLDSVARRLMGRRWYFYIPEEHLHYFNARNLWRLLERTGLEPRHSGPAPKVLTYRYSLTQFREFNPLVYAAMSGVSRLLPGRWLDTPLTLHIGELMVIATREQEAGARAG